MQNNLFKYFQSRYEPEPNTGCWLWTGPIRKDGYGRINLCFNGGSVYLLAHRASFEIFNGNIPCGLLVCHKCDTPSCVNPDHLFVGTHRDNTWDMLRKGRHKNRVRPFGEEHCIHGHYYEDLGWYAVKDKNGRFLRKKCKQCSKTDSKKRYSKKKEVFL